MCFITGRIKRIFIVRQNGIGTKVFPDRIEAVIMQSGYVRECCVIPVTDREKANRVRACVVLNSNIMTDTAEQDILRCCRENLPIQYVPDEIVFLEHLPLTAVGKIDFKTLQAAAEEEKE